MVGEYVGITTFEKAIAQKLDPIKKVEVDKNIINDYKEINDFVLAKKSTISILYDDDKKIVDYAKEHGVDKKEFLNSFKSNLKIENKELEKELKASELDRNYAWYLENKDNKAIKEVLETKKNNYLSEWSKEVDFLESDEKLSYLKSSNNVNFKHEIYNFSTEKINEIIKIYSDFKNEYNENQNNYFKNNGIEIEKEEMKKIDFHSLGEINQDFLSEKEKINDILDIVKITIDDIQKKEEQIRKRNPDLSEKSISDMLAEHIYNDIIKENVSLIEFSKNESFNFDNHISRKEIELERYFNLKENNSIETFNENDLVPFNQIDTLLKERENVIDNKREYPLSTELKEFQDISYKAKKDIALLLNNANILDREIKAEMLEFKDEKLIIITPEYNAEIRTEKLTENNFDKIRNIILNEIDMKASLEDMEKLNKNNEVLFELGQRDTLRELGNDFYKNMIFDKEKEIIKELKVEPEKEKFLELSDKEKIFERAKELGINLEKEEITINKTIEINSNDIENEVKVENEIEINYIENRNEVVNLFANSLSLTNALRIYEDNLNFNYEEIYPYNNIEQNTKFVLANILELIPEIKKNKEEFGFDSENIQTYLEKMNFDNLQLLINNLDNNIKEIMEMKKDDEVDYQEEQKDNNLNNTNNETEEKKNENEKDKNFDY